MYAYALSKAFQIMHAYKLQRHFHEEHRPVNALSVHPGAVYTDMLGRRAGGQAAQAVLRTLLWVSACGEGEESEIGKERG